ncbi:MAG: DUF1579 family protein [Fimbriimonadaceae bacterium]|nr:DUF1579 family protein [Fimbriimonadaceae bacterium]
MAIPKPFLGRAGSYAGPSKLHLAFLPEAERVKECTSELHVEFDRNEKYATITYVWEYEGAKQEGTFIVCGPEDGTTFQMGWVDSYHLDYQIMHLKGNVADMSAKGTYTYGDDEWPWRIAFEFPSDSEIVMKMWFVTQEGEETWAVEGTYKRA